jgi:tRNA (guanine37-N1)-methyltransferase
MVSFHIITIFPEVVDSYLNESILKRAQKKGKIRVKLYNPRDFAIDKHHTVDDRPYGGGPGMVMKAEPIVKAVKKARGRKKKVKIILFAPSGTQLTNTFATQLLDRYTDIILIAGRYEGVDARVKKILDVEEVSIGPYVLTGGELPAMVLIDVVTRRIPGVLGKDASVEERRIASREVYTRPEALTAHGKTYRVPATLRSGHHGEIDVWRGKRKGKNLS